MPGPRPPDTYDPVQTALPDVQQPSDAIRTEATGADFGAQVGGALQQVGQTGERAAGQAMDVALQQQAVINQSLASNAETDYVTKLTNIQNEFKSKEGLDAQASLPAAQAQIAALRQQMLATIPNQAAQRQFNILAQRHEGEALSDAGSYAAGQIKVADAASAHAQIQTYAQQAGSYQTASDDRRFGYALGSIEDGVQRLMRNKGYGSAMQDDGKGGITFDTSTPGGASASAVYTQTRNEARGIAWENRIHALADDPAQGNLAQAQSVFNASRDQIPPEAQMRISAYLQPKLRAMGASQAAGNALQQADQGYTQSVQAALKTGATPGVQPNVDQLTSAIHGQESDGAPTSVTSTDGARGGMQIMPATFQRYALPGESIDNPADNAAVGKRIVSDLATKFNNDPGRVAVAYFSGEGNVAPLGSPTPWKVDKVDGNGKSVSSYTSDVLSRVGVVQTKADYYKSNYSTILDNTRQEALRLHPDDPQAADLAVARTEQQLNASIRQQQLAYGADSNLVYQAANGDLAKGTRPMTIDQMTATSPDVKAAWDRMQSQQPEAAHMIATRIMSENAKSNGGDAHTYGAGFSDVFNRIHADADDPNRITAQDQLYSMVGKPDGLTMAGLEKARAEIAGKNTPDGEAESQMRATLFKTAHQELTGTDDVFGTKDPKGEEQYLKFMAHAYGAIAQAKALGKSPAQIYNPESPDYVGKGMGAFKRSETEKMADMALANSDMLGNTPSGAAPTRTGEPDLSSLAGIRQAYRSGLVPYERAKAALMGLGVGGAASGTASDATGGAALPPAKAE